MTTAFILKHFNSIKETILKINFLNYVNDEVLSQYNDEDILHSVIFYNKNMISAECNYKIYNKELLTIIWCLKHWCCYEHVWIDQSSDLILINLIKASHDAMSSLNLAHLCWTLRVILNTSSRCSALSSFISFIILLDKHIWHITSHLYRV